MLLHLSRQGVEEGSERTKAPRLARNSLVRAMGWKSPTLGFQGRGAWLVVPLEPTRGQQAEAVVPRWPVCLETAWGQFAVGKRHCCDQNVVSEAFLA